MGREETPSSSHRLAYRAYNRVIRRIRSSAALHRVLFGHRPVAGSDAYGPYWDWTTLALRDALRDYLRPEQVFLDMGTGSVGVLALYAHLRVGCHNVVAADYLPEVVALARRNADARRASIDIRESNLFAGISERFDVIAFNAPYLVEDVASVLGVLEDDTAKARFSGGTDGGETIVRFLADAPDHLTPDGKLLLGVNHYHVSPTTVIEAIRQSRLLLDGCVRRKITRAAVYILRPIRESGEPT